MNTACVAYVSIPKGLASVAVASNRELKTYAVFYQLKSLYVGGVIFNYKSRVKEIAQNFGYSERKLRTYVKLLLERGLVEVQNKHNLLLRGSRALAQEQEVSEKKYWRVAVRHLRYLETVLQALALEENLIKQRYTLKNRVVEDIIATHVGIPNPATTLQPARYHKLRKTMVCDYEQVLQRTQSRYISDIASLQPLATKVFPWATLSRQGIAQVLHRKSKATGQRYAKKLAALGLLTEQRNSVFIGDFSYDEFQQLQKTVLNYNPTYHFKNGEVHKVLPNTLAFLPTE
jgi:predicted transcriptional regulator